MPVARRYTVADLALLPDDGNKYELLRGELVVSPAPAVVHQLVVKRLYLQLAKYLEPLGLVDTLFDVPANIRWDSENLVQPDILVIHPDDLSPMWSSVKRLRLAVEVLSPASRRRDRLDKRRLYQEYAVETYWVVDPESQVVERWKPNDERSERVADTVDWRVELAAPVCSIHLPFIFGNLPK